MDSVEWNGMEWNRTGVIKLWACSTVGFDLKARLPLQRVEKGTKGYLDCTVNSKELSNKLSPRPLN